MRTVQPSASVVTSAVPWLIIGSTQQTSPSRPASTDQKAVYEFTKTILDNSGQVNGFADYLKKLSPEFALEWLLKNNNGPVHPGAEQYYKENDLWTDDLLSLEEYEG